MNKLELLLARKEWYMQLFVGLIFQIILLACFAINDTPLDGFGLAFLLIGLVKEHHISDVANRDFNWRSLFLFHVPMLLTYSLF
jgi:hypothetical protein